MDSLWPVPNSPGQSEIPNLVGGPPVVPQHWNFAIVEGWFLSEKNIRIEMKPIEDIWCDAKKEDFPENKENSLIIDCDMYC